MTAGNSPSATPALPAEAATPATGATPVRTGRPRRPRVRDDAGRLVRDRRHPEDCGGREVAAHRKSVSLVIPARNEAHNLAWVLQHIPEGVDDVVLVDGSSTDATMAMATYLRPDVRRVRQHGKGKGEALQEGFASATGDVIVMIDADGSMDPAEIPTLVWYLEHGYDFVKGSRFMIGGGSLDITPLRRFGNRILMLIVNRRFRSRMTDLCYGLCAFQRYWLPALELSATGFEIETEMTIQALTAGLRMTEVPSLELPRRSGKSTLRTFRDGWRVLRTIYRMPRERTLAPITDDTPRAEEGREPT